MMGQTHSSTYATRKPNNVHDLLEGQLSGGCLFLSVTFIFENVTNLKQNEAQRTRAESTHKEVNKRSKHVTQVRQQRPEPPTATLTWYACKYKVHKLHQS